MAPHPWIARGAGIRQCDACKATQIRSTDDGVWLPKFPTDCPNLSDDGDDRRDGRPRGRPPKTPPDNRPDPKDRREKDRPLVDAVSGTVLPKQKKDE